MADISEQLSTISSNRYGQDVRSAIHDSIVAINEESNEAYETAISSDNSLSNLAVSAIDKRDEIKENVEETVPKLQMVSDLYDQIGEWPAVFSIDDENGDPILGSDGNPILGEVIFIVKK